ncbi:MAG TPA: hypothetical protein PKH65_00895 [Bacteroidia bacterium]|nr:hypothetical protein [Bacteroidia bacterium]
MKVKDLLKRIADVRELRECNIRLQSDEMGNQLYNTFTKRHGRVPFIPNKKYGVALIDLTQFKSFDYYLKQIGGKNSAAYFTRKSLRSGNSISIIDPVQLQIEILEINTSSQARQGAEMDESYTRTIEYPSSKHHHYFGVFNNNKLVAYSWMIESGELLLINRILGHANFLDHGIMYHLLTSMVDFAFDKVPNAKYMMYDTMIGASDGLKMYKKRCGFNSYRVNWSI